MSRHNPDDIAIRMDITGTCDYCRHHGTATLTYYYSRELLIRCQYCKQANQFKPDDEKWTDPSRFPPFKGDNDDPQNDNSSGRHTRGTR